MTNLPETIGKYQIEGVAGRGAMGIVYVGHDPYVDRKVAIKVQAFSGGEDDGEGDSTSATQARKMFFNEAKSAGSLDHPNILRIYDAGDANDQDYIVMEYVEGVKTLKSYCATDRLLPIEDVIEHMIDCAEALNYAHQQGVLHRDIKPANLLLTRGGEVKIGDFGIAQRVNSEQTQLTGWFGSPKYMSPEQARDDRLTFQTDIYSLGVVMYELLTGKQPYEASGIQGLITKILTKDPTPILEARADLPERVVKIVHRALEKDLSQRYQTGAELAADLRGVLEGIHDPLVGMSQEEKFHSARELSFFSDFLDSELTEVVRICEWEGHDKDAEVIVQGGNDKAFYVIVSGEVSVIRDGVEIATLADGECFGEMAFVSKARRSCSIVGKEPLTVMRIDGPANDWASLPCQMRLNKTFQQVFIQRLEQTSKRLVKAQNGG